MTEHDALVRAVCEFPDDDIPRLIYSDFLEENGDAERAAFIRAQIELARTPHWQPFAVFCRHRRREWSESSEAFRASLPEIDPGQGVEWHPQAFRRGFGWRVKVHSLHGWKEIAPRLYESAPIGELDLNPPAVLDDWREFARGESIRHLRIIHLDGMSPVEPIRALCESAAAANLTDIYFHRASSPGLPELIEDLLQTPLGRGLKGLHFRVGYESLEHLVDALAGAAATRLERLSLHTMGMTPALLERLLPSAIVRNLQELDLGNDRLADDNGWGATHWLECLPQSLYQLRLKNSHLSRGSLEALGRCRFAKHLKGLDLSGNLAINEFPQVFDSLEHVCLLDLRGCLIGAETLAALANSRCWPRLVGCDLRANQLPMAAVRQLLHVSIPEELTALMLDHRMHEKTRSALHRRFGERAIFYTHKT